MKSKVYNNVSTSLSSPVSPGDSSIQVSDASGIPDPSVDSSYVPIYVYPEGGAHEIMHVTRVSGNSLDVLRAMEGTDPLFFSGNETVQVRLTSESLGNLDSSDTYVSTTGGDKKLSESLRERVISIGDISKISSIEVSSLSEGEMILVHSYHPGLSKGGGIFTWEPSTEKSKHDGVKYFSPTVEWDGSSASLPAFISGSSETDPSGEGCFSRDISGVVSLFDAGAIGDGIEDDDDSCVAWWSLITSENLKGWVPPGRFRKTSELFHDFSVYIEGSGSEISKFLHEGSGSCFRIAKTGPDYIDEGGSFSGFGILGTSDPVAHTGTNGNGFILSKLGRNWSFFDIDVRQCDRGLYAEDSYIVGFNNCSFFHNRREGVWTQTASNNFTWTNCTFSFNGTVGIRASGIQGSIFGCDAEGNEEIQANLLGRGWSVNGNYFEKPVRGFPLLRIEAVGASIDGNIFYDFGVKGSSGDVIAVQVAGGSQMVSVSAGNTFSTAETGEMVAVDIQSGSTRNISYLRPEDEWRNNGGATNKNIDVARVAQEDGGVISCSDGTVIPHSLGVVPDRVTLTPIGSSPRFLGCSSRSSSSITVSFRNSAGDPISSGEIVSWTVSK